jgi:hypothetical protein
VIDSLALEQLEAGQPTDTSADAATQDATQDAATQDEGPRVTQLDRKPEE